MSDDPRRLLRRWIAERQRIEFDVGCSSGSFLLRLGRHRPRVRAMGVEIRKNTMYQCRRSIEKSGLTNVAVIHGEAVEILGDRALVPDGSVSVVHAYFPTPVEYQKVDEPPILRGAFFEAARRVLHDGGLLRMATDDADLFEAALDALPADGWLPTTWDVLDLSLERGQQVGSSAEALYLDRPDAWLNLLQLRRC